jgi:hypothetical protein
MSASEGKFDTGLRLIHHAYRLIQQGHPSEAFAIDGPVPSNGMLNITVQCSGDLQELERLGFTLASTRHRSPKPPHRGSRLGGGFGMSARIGGATA